MKAAEFLFREHPEISSLILNPGAAPGSDLETKDCGGAVLHYRDSRLSVPAGTEPAWIAELMKAFIPTCCQ